MIQRYLIVAPPPDDAELAAAQRPEVRQIGT